MEKKEPGYAEAMAQIEEILSRLDGGQLDIDSLAAEVRRATELIKVCKQRLRKAEQDVTAALKED